MPRPKASTRLHSGTVLVAYQRELLVQPGLIEAPRLKEPPLAVDLPRALYRTMGKLVVGDEIEYERGSRFATATNRLPRKSEFYRSGPSGKPQLLFSNLEQLVICSSPRQPDFRPGLVDRLLVAALAQELEVLLILNKSDLVESEAARRLLEPYERLGKSCLIVSAETGEGLDELLAALQGRCSALVGHSGVGKSSLINLLAPGSAQRVGAVLEDTGKGQHTTTRSRLIPLPTGGFLLDSPGIRMFGLAGLEPLDVARLYPDFQELEPCRFNNCLHLTEMDCSVRSAVEQGGISAARALSYQRLVYSLDASLPVSLPTSGPGDEEPIDEEAAPGIDEDAELDDPA